MSVYKTGNTIPESVITLGSPGSDTSYVDAGAGTYYLSIGSANARWTVTVDECSTLSTIRLPLHPSAQPARHPASTPTSTPVSTDPPPKPKPQRSLSATYSTLGDPHQVPTIDAGRRVSAGIPGAEGKSLLRSLSYCSLVAAMTYRGGSPICVPAEPGRAPVQTELNRWGRDVKSSGAPGSSDQAR